MNKIENIILTLSQKKEFLGRKWKILLNLVLITKYRILEEITDEDYFKKIYFSGKKTPLLTKLLNIQKSIIVII